jgi:hypothetical protein
MESQWMVVPNFHHHAGSHCESTSLANYLQFLGFSYSEAMIFGLDATMGFSFWGIPKEKSDFSGLIIGGKQGFFMEYSLACRLLGVQVEKRAFQSDESAWEDLKTQIEQNHPLMLQLDMGYLPYFPDLELFHFGGHFVNAFGYCESANPEVLIGDNDFVEPHKVPLNNVSLARGSKKGPKFMQPGRVRYVLSVRLDGKRPPFAAAVKLAIQQVVKNMLSPSISQLGLPALKRFREALDEWPVSINESAMKPADLIETIYGCIETWGTGGSIFRKLYYTFLQEVLENNDVKSGPRAWTTQEIEILKSNLPILEQSVSNWKLFADELLRTKNKNKENPQIELNYDYLRDLIIDIEEKEREFFTQLSKIKL